MSLVAVEGFDPSFPGTAGGFLDGCVTHAGDERVLRRCRRRCGGNARRRSPKQLSAGGGVGLAGLPHARANDALEILVGWHRGVSLLGEARTHAPQQRPFEAPKVDQSMRIPGVCPPLPRLTLLLGKSRGG